MILLDANLLIYARGTSLPQHAAAKKWLDEMIGGETKVGMPWPSLLGFLRVITNRRVFTKADSITSAWKQIEDWLSCPNVWIPMPGENHTVFLARTVADSGGSDRVPDAHLAALAIEHGLTLCSSDRDFARFRGLKWQNPLAP